MAKQKRWQDPANEGQVDYNKVIMRFFMITIIWLLAAVLKIAIDNNWLGSLGQTRSSLGL